MSCTSEKYFYDELAVKLGVKYKKDKINLVESKCGSRKSYHCVKMIRRINAIKNIYHVTDTRMLRESIKKDLPSNVRVITYTTLGKILSDSKKCREFIENTEIIFLDEIHQLFRYVNKFNILRDEEEKDKGQQEKQFYRIAITWLYTLPIHMRVVALSATPGAFLQHSKHNDELYIINQVLDKDQINRLLIKLKFQQNYKI